MFDTHHLHFFLDISRALDRWKHVDPTHRGTSNHKYENETRSSIEAEIYLGEKDWPLCHLSSLFTLPR